MKENTKKVVAMSLIGVAGIGLGAVSGAFMFPVQNEVYVPYEVEVEVEKIINNTIEVPVEIIKEIEVEKIVEIDNGNLDLVLDYMYNEDVELILNDLDEEDIDEIVDRIIFMNDTKSIAEEYVKDNLLEEVDRKRVGGIRLYEQLIDRVRLDKEINLDDIDFKYDDAVALVTGSFRQDDNYFSFEAEVIFKDGEVDDFKVDVSRD